MSCIFHATGFNFDVDGFFQQSGLVADQLWHRGEPRLLKRLHQDSGFKMVASEADMSDLKQQIEDAITFLKTNQAELEKLRGFPNIETLSLDFGVEDRDVAAQFDYFPPELLRLAGNMNIGIEISRYPA